jgi:hypothetical protein
MKREYVRSCPTHGGVAQERPDDSLWCLAGQHVITRHVVVDTRENTVVNGQPHDDEVPAELREKRLLGRKIMANEGPTPKKEKGGRFKLTGHGETLWLRHLVKGHGDHRVAWQQIGKGSIGSRMGTVAVFTSFGEAAECLTAQLAAAKKRGWAEAPIVSGRLQFRALPDPGSMAKGKGR